MILPEILGWPGAVSGDPDGSPGGQTMTDQMLRTMPICYLEPMQQAGQLGLEIFTLQPAWGDFKKYLAANDIMIQGSTISNGSKFPGLKIMYQDLSPMSETYTNTYSPSALLSGIQEGLSGTAGELMYITGKNIRQNIDTAAKSENKTLAGVGGAVNDLLAGGEGLLGDVMGKDKAHQIMSAMTSGQKIDFPMMWKGSSFSASYDLSVRLYNPSPASDYYYSTLILAPMAAIMALALPKTALPPEGPVKPGTEGSDLTYQWPYLVKFTIPGLVRLDAAYISNVSVVKGGDVNDRAWNNRPNIIDIRLTISPLYNTMLLTTAEPTSQQPTLGRELDNMMLVKDEIDPGTIGSPNAYVPEKIQVENNSPFLGQTISSSSRFSLSPAEIAAGNDGTV